MPPLRQLLAAAARAAGRLLPPADPANAKITRA
jgi:hypothetical protein